MLMIRMQRIGRRNDPAFRIVVLEKTSSPKAGTYTDLLGTYNPKTKAFNVNGDRVKHWLSQGAQLSDSLHNLFVVKGVIEGKKKQVISTMNLEKNKPKEELVVAAAPAPVAEAAAPEAAPAAEEAVVEAAAVAEAEVVEEVAEAPAEAPAAEIAAEAAPEVVETPAA